MTLKPHPDRQIPRRKRKRKRKRKRARKRARALPPNSRTQSEAGAEGSEEA